MICFNNRIGKHLLCVLLSFVGLVLHAQESPKYAHIFVRKKVPEKTTMEVFMPINAYCVNTDTPNFVRSFAGDTIELEIPAYASPILYHFRMGPKEFQIGLLHGDSVHVLFDNDTAKSQPTFTFVGSNGYAHNYFVNRRIDRIVLPTKAYGKNSYAQFVQVLKDYTGQTGNIWDSMADVQNENREICELYKTEIISASYDEGFRELVKIYDAKRDSVLKRNLKIWQVLYEYIKTREVLFQMSQSFDPGLLRTNSGTFLYNRYLKTVNWEDPSIDSAHKTESSLYYFNRYDRRYRYAAWGAFLHNAFYSPGTFYNFGGELDENLEEYVNAGGDSTYISEINKIAAPRYAKMCVPVEVGQGEYPELTKLLAAHKKRFVYIDLWAKWCMFCMLDLQKYSGCPDSLAKLGIGYQMLCVDDDSTAAGKYLAQKKISIIHNRNANAVLRKELLSLQRKLNPDWTRINLPYCILYDARMRIFYINFLRPSHKKRLYDTLKEQMAKND
ncbi:MAG: hypothetical protein QM610_11795 [Chitinophagaceae bacterium]